MAKAERDRKEKWLAKIRLEQRIVRIPPCANPRRRAKCLADPLVFLKTYFPGKYANPWTTIQREMIATIVGKVDPETAGGAGDQAIAGPRGCAKTTCTEGAAIYCAFRGWLRFVLILAATGPDSSRILDNIKFAIESSDLLAADFPEVCVPIRALEGAPQRGNMQTAIAVDSKGKPIDPEAEPARTKIEWSSERCVFPTVAGSVCSGAIIFARGIDGSIRGLNVHGRRPDFVLLDDIDTAESAWSEHLSAKRERAIERDVSGLGGPGLAISKVLLCTPLNRTCLAFRYTSPELKPAWNGKRYKILEALPDAHAKWLDEYIDRRKAAQLAGDHDGRAATKWYKENRAELDAGAVATDPLRYVKRVELSAIQHAYNIIADRGLEAFETEYQCEPPEIEGPEGSGITPLLVASRTNALPRGIAPEGSRLAIGIDIGDHLLHWVAVAADANAAAFVIDYGAADVLNVSPEDINPAIGRLQRDHALRKANIEREIRAALVRLRASWIAAPYFDVAGAPIEIKRALVDSGSGMHRNLVYSFCREVGQPFAPSKGFGKGRGVFHDRKKTSNTAGVLRIGDRWAIVQQSGGVLLNEFDADHWKRNAHERILTPTLGEDGQPERGSLSLYRPTLANDHKRFARQIAAEIWTSVFQPGKPERQGWDVRFRDNHYLDAAAMALVGLSQIGVSVIDAKLDRRVVSMRALQAAARAKK